MTARLADSGLKSQPLRVVLDSRGRVVDGPLMDTKLAPTLIFTSTWPENAASVCRGKECAEGARQRPFEGVFHVAHRWRESGVDVCDVPLVSWRLDLQSVLLELGKRGVLQVMVEGGAVLQGQMLKEGLCEELRVYIGATLSASMPLLVLVARLGSSAQPWAQVPLTSTIAEVNGASVRHFS